MYIIFLRTSYEFMIYSCGLKHLCNMLLNLIWILWAISLILLCISHIVISIIDSSISLLNYCFIFLWQSTIKLLKSQHFFMVNHSIFDIEEINHYNRFQILFYFNFLNYIILTFCLSIPLFYNKCRICKKILSQNKCRF